MPENPPRQQPETSPDRRESAVDPNAKTTNAHFVSDVFLADGTTGAAPTFAAPLPPGEVPTAPLPYAPEPAARDRAPLAMLPGARIDDFEIVRLLGRGAFGHVYLARQLSLDRHVALKVSANRGSEGRTMARLEHQHIVQVFSEKVDLDFNQRLLCMQLVPGVGMERLINALHASRAGSGAPGAPQWSGADLLATIDRSSSLPAALDTAALHDREALGKMDAVEATAWFGARLAEALDFAHRNGVLHRDIKPANILVNSYGRPLLADFNISSQPVGSEPSGDEMFGGTFAYMSPEHLDAFNPSDSTEHEAVTAQSDLYSLGLVLKQLLDGRLHFALPESEGNLGERLRRMADERRAQRPTVRDGPPCARKTLERTIARCLAPSPVDRYASGALLAEQLDGCRRLREAERRMPPLPQRLRAVARRPLTWLLVLIILPQLAGSAINIIYNTTQIVSRLDERQTAVFFNLVGIYNVVVYPLAIAALIWLVRPVWRGWKLLASDQLVPDEQVHAARWQALQLPQWVALLSAIGWFPGGAIFPLVIATAAPPLDGQIAAHFLASFCLSGLVALAYSLCGLEWIVLRVLYPGMWSDVRDFGQRATQELAPVERHLAWAQWLAVTVPLVGAMLTVLSAPADGAVFRWLIFSLIILGILGIHVAGLITRRLGDVIVALTSSKA